MSKPKLTLEDKLSIVKSEGASRGLAEKHGVHHSTINGLRSEAEKMLKEHWNQKSSSIGRPAKVVDKEVAVTQKLLEDMEKERQTLEIERDWARLQHKLAEDKLDDAYRKKEINVAKKKKALKQKKKK